MTKTRHDGDCTFYSSIINGEPEDGICTCGYAHQEKLKGDDSYFELMVSEERIKYHAKLAYIYSQYARNKYNNSVVNELS